MADVAEVTGEKCGNCKFGQRVNVEQVDCFGNPPSVHVLGVGKDAIGRPTMHLETFVPRVAAQREACSLYKFRLQIVDLTALANRGNG